MNASQAPPQQQQKLFYGWIITIAGFLLLMCYSGTGFYTFAVFMKPLEVEFGCSRSEIALTVSIYLITNGLFAPFLGRLIQIIGPRKIIRIGAFCTSACLLLISFTPNLLIFQGLYSLLAVCFTGIGYIPLSTLVANWFKQRKGLGIATGIVYTGISAGGLIFVPLIGRLNQALGWRLSFVFLAATVLVIAVPIALFVIKEPSDLTETHSGQPQLKRKKSTAQQSATKVLPAEQPLKKILLSRPFIWLFITVFCGAMAQVGILQHQVAMMSEKGISYITASTVMGIASGIGGAGKIFFGRLTEILKLKWVVVLCYGMQAIGVLILYFLSSAISLWAYAIIFGFGMGGILMLQPLAVRQYFSLRVFSVLIGILTFDQLLGGACGAYSAGVLYDHFGNYQLTLSIFFVLYVAGLSAIFLAGEPPRVGQRQA